MSRRGRRDADQALVMALACGASAEIAAQKAGVAVRTVYRRLAERPFCTRLHEARAEIVQRTAGLLTGAALGSVKTLVDIQQDVAVPPGVRRRAARDVLELGIRFRENADLEERVGALEERLSDGLHDAGHGGRAA